MEHYFFEGSSNGGLQRRLRQVLIVSDNLATGERMSAILRSLAPDAEVTAVGSAGQAHELLASRSFSLALVAMELPDGGALSMLQHLREHQPLVERIAISATHEPQWARAALSAGVAGYLIGDADDVQLRFLLASLDQDGAALDPRVARQVLGLLSFARRNEAPPMPVVAPMPAEEPPKDKKMALLSARELKVLSLIAQGCTNREIAEAVFLSVNTIEFHAKSIYRKLAVSSRTQAVHEARQFGLLH